MTGPKNTFYGLSEEQILAEAMAGARDYVSDIRHDGQFVTERCVVRELQRIKQLYRKCRKEGPYSPLRAEEWAELDAVLAYFEPVLWERTAPVRERFLRQKTLSQINASTAGARVREAFGSAGIRISVTEQKYRLRVTAEISRKNSLRFYVNYRDLGREGLMEGLVKAVLDIRDGAAVLGHGVMLSGKS